MASRSEHLRRFQRYFLQGQEEGGEIYLCNDIAMVVYSEERWVGFDSVGKISSGVFGSLADLEVIEPFRRVRRKENSRGIRPEISKDLGYLLNVVGAWGENEWDIFAMTTYNHALFQERTGVVCPLVRFRFLEEADGDLDWAIELYQESISR
jgi:hypothetical protein